MHDAKALQRLQRGDEEALAWLMDRYTPYVHTVVCHIMGQYMSQADMEEVDADVFVALWHNAASIRPAALKGWLGSVARNAAKNKLRGAGQEIPLEDDVMLLSEDTPEDEALRAEFTSVMPCRFYLSDAAAVESALGKLFSEEASK